MKRYVIFNNTADYRTWSINHDNEMAVVKGYPYPVTFVEHVDDGDTSIDFIDSDKITRCWSIEKVNFTIVEGKAAEALFL